MVYGHNCKFETMILTNLFLIHIIFGYFKCNTHMMVTKLHYLWERKMQYLHDKFKMHTKCGWQNVLPTL